MKDTVKRRYDKFTREIAFVTANAADFAAGSQALIRQGNLKEVVKQMDAAKLGQGGGDATPKSVLLDALRLDLAQVRRLAVARDTDEPGFANRFSALANSETGILTAAGKYLEQLVPDDEKDTPAEKAAKAEFVAWFVSHELPADFVENIQSDVEDINTANLTMDNTDEAGTENTAALGRLTRDGMKESAYLDAIMRAKYARNSDKLRGWETASHLERAPVRAKKPAPAQPAK